MSAVRATYRLLRAWGLHPSAAAVLAGWIAAGAVVRVAWRHLRSLDL